MYLNAHDKWAFAQKFDIFQVSLQDVKIFSDQVCKFLCGGVKFRAHLIYMCIEVQKKSTQNRGTQTLEISTHKQPTNEKTNETQIWPLAGNHQRAYASIFFIKHFHFLYKSSNTYLRSANFLHIHSYSKSSNSSKHNRARSNTFLDFVNAILLFPYSSNRIKMSDPQSSNTDANSSTKKNALICEKKHASSFKIYRKVQKYALFDWMMLPSIRSFNIEHILTLKSRGEAKLLDPLKCNSSLFVNVDSFIYPFPSP